jgi:small subunit ribosomal protein S3
LQEDKKLRKYVRNRLKKAGISRIIINRTSKNIILTIHTSRPGVVIGKSGKEIAQLEQEFKKLPIKKLRFRLLKSKDLN